MQSVELHRKYPRPEYNGVPMNGFFDSKFFKGLVKAAVAAICVSIAGPLIGGAIGGWAATQVDGWFWPAPPQSTIGHHAKLSIADNLDLWLKNELKPWVEQLTAGLNPSEILSDSYRNELNDVLRSLQVARAYYSHKQSTEPNKKEIWQNKKQAVEAFIGALSGALIQAYQEAGKEVIQVNKNVIASNYTGSKPEPFTWTQSIATTYKEFASKTGNTPIGDNPKDGYTPIGENPKGGSGELVVTPKEGTQTPEKSPVKNRTWLLLPAVGVGLWVLPKFFQNKKK